MKTRRMTPTRRLAELQVFIDLCFASLVSDESIGVDLKEAANRSGLSVSTLRRLRSGAATLNTRFGTVQALGYVAGFAIEFLGTEARMSCL